MASEGYYTKFSNYVFDYVMPDLSPAAFKVLMFTIRKTLGWRKDCDEISYAQFMEGTGIGSRSTVSSAIDELEVKGYVIVIRDRGTTNLYAINAQVLSVTTTVESAEVTATSTEGVLDASTETVPEEGGTSTETVHTKESSRKPSVSNDELIAVTELQQADYFSNDFGVNIRMLRRISKDFPRVNVINAVSSAVGAILEGETVRSPYGFLRYYFQKQDKERKKSWEEQYANAHFVD